MTQRRSAVARTCLLPFGEVQRILDQGELGPFASMCSPQTASFCLHRSSEHPGAVSILGLRLASCSSRSLELRIAGLVGREKARRAASLEAGCTPVDVDAGLRPAL